jgi:glycosyltransferase involved in cell wall biosynthesis
MRVLFVCGSYAQELDGVADYTHRLSKRISGMGIECAVVSINDKYTEKVMASSRGCELGTEIEWLRIPAKTRLVKKRQYLRSELNRFQPDWISLQYVPYSYNDKGVPLWLLYCLYSASSMARWHWMTHELWVDPDACLRNRLIAPLQKLLLKSLSTILKPAVVQTSNEYYVDQLKSIGISASILPLFSNIKVENQDYIGEQAHSGLRLITFGSIHAEWRPEILITKLKKLAQKHNLKPLTFVSIGHAGAYGERIWQDLSRENPEWLRFEKLGKLTASQVSLQLQRADFGITTTPSHLLGKSGSVAAMLAHKLQVIVPRLDRVEGRWHKSLLYDDRFLLLDSLFEQRLLNSISRKDSLRRNERLYDDPLDRVSCLFLETILQTT